MVPATRALVSLIIPLANRTKGAVVAAAMSSVSSDGEQQGKIRTRKVTNKEKGVHGV